MSDADMVKGLVRAAELLEQRDGGTIWDDEVRRALDQARLLGWGKNQTGATAPSPGAAPADLACGACAHWHWGGKCSCECDRSSLLNPMDRESYARPASPPSPPVALVCDLKCAGGPCYPGCVAAAPTPEPCGRCKGDRWLSKVDRCPDCNPPTETREP